MPVLLRWRWTSCTSSSSARVLPCSTQALQCGGSPSRACGRAIWRLDGYTAPPSCRLRFMQTPVSGPTCCNSPHPTTLVGSPTTHMDSLLPRRAASCASHVVLLFLQACHEVATGQAIFDVSEFNEDSYWSLRQRLADIRRFAAATACPRDAFAQNWQVAQPLVNLPFVKGFFLNPGVFGPSKRLEKVQQKSSAGGLAALETHS